MESFFLNNDKDCFAVKSFEQSSSSSSSSEEEEEDLSSKKTLVIENVFSSGLFDESSAETCKKLEKKCLTFGKVAKFIACENHPKGICIVHFEKLCAADMAQVCLDHELFDGRIILADYWDGKTSFEEFIPSESELPTESPVEDFAFGSISPNCSYEDLRDTQTWKRRQKIDNPMLVTKREMNQKTKAKKVEGSNNNEKGYVLIWWTNFATMA